MSRTVDWEIPGEIQPKPGDCAFDLDRALSAVLGLRATIPEDAFSAGTLGTERAGSGVLIRKDGLVQALGKLNVPPIDLGIGVRVGAGDRAIMAARAVAVTPSPRGSSPVRN